MHLGSSEPPQLRSCRRCGARTRNAKPCRSPCVRARSRCRMHGGAHGSGAPVGKRNGAFRAGRHTKSAIAERRRLGALLVLMRAGVRAAG
ncbi:MAG: HGGxSTG domain-containing protein [Hyphomicrobiaceae bacterium]